MLQIHTKKPQTTVTAHQTNHQTNQQKNQGYYFQSNNSQTFGTNTKKSPLSALALLSFLFLPLFMNAQSFLSKGKYNDHATVKTHTPAEFDNIRALLNTRHKTAPPNQFIVGGNNPPVNEADYNEINNILAGGNTVVISFNETLGGVSNSLAKEVFNTYFSGVQATELENKLVITIDANRFRNNQNNKINFASINAFKWNSEIGAFKRAVAEKALPNLDRASQIGGPASKESVGQAIKVIAELTQQHFTETDNTGIILAGILIVLGLLGIGAAGYSYHQVKKSRKEVVNQVKDTLNLANSKYKVGIFNVFKPSTFNALMDITPATADLELSMIESLNEVTPELLKKHRADVYNGLVSEKGLYNDSAKVRQWVVNQLAQTEGFLDRRGKLENYYELIELLRQEKSGIVQEALVNGLLEHTEEGDISFLQDQSAGSDGLELLMLYLFKKFPKADYVDNFLTQLKTEQRPVHRNSLLTLASGLIKDYKEKADSLLPYISSDTALDFREMAIQTLGMTEDEKFFQPLLTQYVSETNPTVKQLMIDPLKQTLHESETKGTFYPIFKGDVDNIPVEELSWKILSSSTDHVEPLITYLERPHTRFPSQAIELLASSVTKNHSERLQGILSTYEKTVTTKNNDLVTDYEPVMGAIAGLKKLKDTKAVNELFGLLDNPELEFIHDEIILACEGTPNDARNYAYLQQQLAANPSESSKVAAIALLDNYGQQALPLLLETYTQYNEPVKTAAEKSILRVARNDEGCYETVLDAANNKHEAAEKAVLDYYNKWQNQYDYDHLEYRIKLKTASLDSTNTSVSTLAGSIYNVWVTEKANECKALGQNTSVDNHSAYNSTISKLLNYRNAEEQTIQDHANGGLSVLVKRLGNSADVDSSSDYDNAHSAITTVEHQTDNPVNKVAEKARLKLEQRREDYLEEQERLRQLAAEQQEKLMEMMTKSTNDDGFSITTSSSGYRSPGSGGGGYGTKSWGAM